MIQERYLCDCRKRYQEYLGDRGKTYDKYVYGRGKTHDKYVRNSWSTIDTTVKYTLGCHGPSLDMQTRQDSMSHPST